MKTVVFNIQTLDTALANFATARKTGKGDSRAQIGFETWELMHKVLSPKRLDIIRAMAGASARSPAASVATSRASTRMQPCSSRPGS